MRKILGLTALIAWLGAPLEAPLAADVVPDTYYVNLGLFERAGADMAEALNGEHLQPAHCGGSGDCAAAPLSGEMLGASLDFTLPYGDLPMSLFAGLGGGGLGHAAGGISFTAADGVEVMLWADSALPTYEPSDDAQPGFGLMGVLRF